MSDTDKHNQDYDLYLSYSGRKVYLTCPSMYKHRYILKTESKRDSSTALFGLIIGKVFEWFYERQIWSHENPVSATLALIRPATIQVFKDEKIDNIDQKYLANVKQDVANAIPHGVEAIRVHRLISSNSRAELDMKLTYHSSKHDLSARLGGRADFVHYHSPTDVWILDGKGSRHRDKYVEAEQLIWYATQHYLKFRVAPNRLGFLYWRFPEDPIQWIDYNSQSIRDSLDLTFDVIKKIKLKVFNTKTSSDCGLCAYISKCKEGTEYVAERNVASGGRIESSIFDLDQIT